MPTVTPWPRAKKLNAFLLLCFGGSALVVGLFLLTGRPWQGGLAAAVSVFYGFVPGLAALTVRGALSGELVREAFGIRLVFGRWLAVPWLLPPALVLATAAIALLFPGTVATFGTDAYLEHFGEAATPELEERLAAARDGLFPPVVRDLILGVLTGATVGGLLALVQELAWRGFLHAELPGGAVQKGVVIGLIWAAFRAPIVWLGAGPVDPLLAVVLMTAWCVPASVLFGVVRERGNSIVPVALLHGAINGTAGVAPLLTRGAGPEIAGIHGVAGIVAMAIAAALFVGRASRTAVPGPSRPPARE